MATVTHEQAEVLAGGAGPGRDDAPDGTSALLLLRLSPEMNRAIEALMVRTSLPKGDVINMAVGLLKAAVEAADRGKRVGIAGDDAELEVEFTGF